MNGAPHSIGKPETAAVARGRISPIGYLRARFGFNLDWITRPLFGVLLAAIAVVATIEGGATFALFIAVGACAAVREWHRMFGNGRYLIPTLVSALTIVAALSTALVYPVGGLLRGLLPFAVLAVGAVLNLGIGLARHQAPLANAAGPLYVGLASLSLVILRQSAPHPDWILLIFFAAVWATDTGALFLGNLIGGPKLAPVLSPNKTWAGFLGGIACAALAAMLVALPLRAALVPAIVFGVIVALAGHLGDLFESMMKRRAGRKNSGSLIPGHGGVLDRIDSTLFAAPVAALLVLIAGFDPLAGLPS